MNKRSNEILCKDCNENYINEERFKKFGVCLSCQRRMTMAKTHNFKYVPYKDLPQSEKDRLTKQRETNNRWFKKKNAKLKANGDENKLRELLSEIDKVPPEFLVGKFLAKYGYDKLSSVYVKGSDLYNEFEKYCKQENYKLIDIKDLYIILMDKYKYNRAIGPDGDYIYKGIPEDEVIDRLVTVYENIVRPETKLKSNQIYTPEIVDEIKATANENISVAELRQIFINKYPELNITASNFNNIIARHKIPHAKRTYGKSKVIDEQIIVNPVKTNKLYITDNNIVENLEIDEPIDFNEVPEPPQDLQPKHIIKQELDEDGDPIRLQPIKQEVVSILDEKFKEKKCRNQFNYTVDDYINMLEMFEYLAGNIDGLIKCRDAQFNIVNDYQFDIVHEMENELAEEGNTYLQDKMYVMRDYRRYMEVDYKALKQLRPVLKLIRGMIHPSNPNNPDDPKSISGCLKALKQTISENAQPKFVPRVDVDMTKKYDWAINKNSRYKKAVAQSVPQQEISTTETEQFLQSTLVDEPIKLNKEEKYDLGKQLDTIDKQIKEDKPIAKSIPIQDRSIKANASLKSLKSNVKLTEEQVKAGFGVYRVSCRISGGGFGVFRPWYKDYSCVKEEIAMAFAQQEFAKMKAENGSLLFTEIECHKLNVV